MATGFIDYYSPFELLEFYESDALFAKVVDMLADDAALTGFSLSGISRAATEYLQKQLDSLEWDITAAEALRYQRIFGGALIFILTDEENLERPLQPGESVKGLMVYHSGQCVPHLDREGNPESFLIRTNSREFTVHHSRCLLFKSDPLPDHATDPITGFWGIPMFIRIHDALDTVNSAHAKMAKILNNAVQPVFMVSNLAELLNTEEGERNVQRRIEAASIGKGLYSTAIISEQDSFKYASGTDFLVDNARIVDQTYEILCAVTGIPKHILTDSTTADTTRRHVLGGQDRSSPELYQNLIRDLQIHQLKPALLRLLEIITEAGAAAGELKEPERAKVSFLPLYPAKPLDAAAGELKAAQATLKRVQTVQQYMNMEAITPEEARKILRTKDNSFLEAER